MKESELYSESLLGPCSGLGELYPLRPLPRLSTLCLLVGLRRSYLQDADLIFVPALPEQRPLPFLIEGSTNHANAHHSLGFGFVSF